MGESSGKGGRAMKAKQFLLAVFVLGVGVALAGEAWARNLYSMGTASTAGTYYILGAGFAAHINKRCPTVKVTAEITAGTLENYYLLKRKKMDFGFLSPDIVTDDLVEKKYGGGAKEKLRILIWSSHTSDYHWFVRKKSPLKDICDVKGKTVGVGPMGTSGMIQAVGQIRAACGYEPGRNYKALYYTYAESQNAIKDDTIDIGDTSAGTPVASVVELARAVDIRLLSWTPEQQKKILELIPVMIPVTIPGGVYKGVDHDVRTVGTTTGILCRADLPDEDVYQIIKALFTDVPDRNKFHPQAEKYDLRSMVEIGKVLTKRGLPYHPGVVRYLKEIGAWNPELEAP
jgi:TRAP transporter TAXI family solute receptor